MMMITTVIMKTKKLNLEKELEYMTDQGHLEIKLLKGSQRRLMLCYLSLVTTGLNGMLNTCT